MTDAPEIDLITLREYKPADFPMICEWRNAHGVDPLPEAIFPKFGLIAMIDGEDSAAAWLYMSNSNGACWIEWIVSRPGISLVQSKRCFEAIVTLMRQRASEMNYGVMFGHCLPAMVRSAQSLGFFVHSTHNFSIVSLTS